MMMKSMNTKVSDSTSAMFVTRVQHLGMEHAKQSARSKTSKRCPIRTAPGSKSKSDVFDSKHSKPEKIPKKTCVRTKVKQLLGPKRSKGFKMLFLAFCYLAVSVSATSGGRISGTNLSNGDEVYYHEDARRLRHGMKDTNWNLKPRFKTVKPKWATKHNPYAFLDRMKGNLTSKGEMLPKSRDTKELDDRLEQALAKEAESLRLRNEELTKRANKYKHAKALLQRDQVERRAVLEKRRAALAKAVRIKEENARKTEEERIRRLNRLIPVVTTCTQTIGIKEKDTYDVLGCKRIQKSSKGLFRRYFQVEGRNRKGNQFTIRSIQEQPSFKNKFHHRKGNITTVEMGEVLVALASAFQEKYVGKDTSKSMTDEELCIAWKFEGLNKVSDIDTNQNVLGYQTKLPGSRFKVTYARKIAKNKLKNVRPQ